MHTHSTANYRFHKGFFLLVGGKYTHWPKVLRSLVHPPAQGAGFPSALAGPRCWVP